MDGPIFRVSSGGEAYTLPIGAGVWSVAQFFPYGFQVIHPVGKRFELVLALLLALVLALLLALVLALVLEIVLVLAFMAVGEATAIGVAVAVVVLVACLTASGKECP